jgi:hypothetical protein
MILFRSQTGGITIYPGSEGPVFKVFVKLPDALLGENANLYLERTRNFYTRVTTGDLTMKLTDNEKREILKLIHIAPPFEVGADFRLDIEIG